MATSEALIPNKEPTPGCTFERECWNSWLLHKPDGTQQRCDSYLTLAAYCGKLHLNPTRVGDMGVPL